MVKWIRNFLLFFAVVFGLLAAYGWFHKAELEAAMEKEAIRQLNKQLKAVVQVGGDIGLSFRHSFPQVALAFEDVVVFGSVPFEQDTLLRAKRLDLVLEPFVKARYAALDERDRQRFAQLVACEDQELYAWFLGREVPEDKELAAIVSQVLAFTHTPPGDR